MKISTSEPVDNRTTPAFPTGVRLPTAVGAAADRGKPRYEAPPRAPLDVSDKEKALRII